MEGDSTAASSLPAIPGSVLSGYATIPLTGLGLPVVANGQVTITFDKVETGKPLPSYTDQGVVFALARQPSKNKAVKCAVKWALVVAVDALAWRTLMKANSKNMCAVQSMRR